MRGGPQHRAEQRADGYGESRLLVHLTDYRLGVRLALPHSATRHRPPAATWLMCSPHEEKQPGRVPDHGADAADDRQAKLGHGHEA
ncbi:hypothetical protein GTS_16550 [Gandjariella thermophila]|uniref:Uncharacterized protein n=1 Tax=Gandjariella thermophila TaxID=1931992 RepID=A0A4D4J4M3_9PSEU|nr:hypothetical protein GTS_16550 [Gandjariella thermophila]